MTSEEHDELKSMLLEILVWTVAFTPLVLWPLFLGLYLLLSGQ